MENNYMSHVPGEQFIWFAKYGEEGGLSEFKENPNDRHLFKDIDKTLLTNFGFMGRGHYFSFDTKTGVFDIFGHKIAMNYINPVTNEVTPLICNEDVSYNDLIAFRHGEAIYAGVGIPQQGTVTAYSFGYKTRINDECNIKFIFSIVANEHPYFEFTIVFADDREAIFELIDNGESIGKLNASFKANVGKDLKWVIKTN